MGGWRGGGEDEKEEEEDGKIEREGFILVLVHDKVFNQSDKKRMQPRGRS